ncbi:hypothetical protein VFPPC_03132 [Pochonia chlamydosporia 170]|uniref:Uncharacterized protein n=1 Tax=Pochonia chlamydosporia 170 TaxID=1380566 RepID=A0A179G0D9_METCM|nr:hypothetical protein VFPPC_03132 [Pochonia chlamydosporia 170]OAQ70699.1 hypothetical protein VFPPC_03132 [Pochonia chlamydosporia 170]
MWATCDEARPARRSDQGELVLWYWLISIAYREDTYPAERNCQKNNSTLPEHRHREQAKINLRLEKSESLFSTQRVPELCQQLEIVEPRQPERAWDQKDEERRYRGPQTAPHVASKPQTMDGWYEMLLAGLGVNASPGSMR